MKTFVPQNYYETTKMANFSDLVDKTITKVEINERNDEILFHTLANERFVLWHSQDCCENVSIEDVCGDWNDIIGSPILQAEENSSKENPEGVKKDYQDSFTWTFYRLTTIKGQVVIRFYGESNGYYSETVDFNKFI